jgi:hypothetical protein
VLQKSMKNASCSAGFLRGDDSMAKRAQTTTMDKVKDAILGTDGRGSLYRWLRQHHDEFAEVLDQVSRPDWKRITEALSGENLLDAAGKRPTPERVRQTWVKVRKDVEASRRKKATKAQPAAGPPSVRLLASSDETKPASTDDAIEQLRREMDQRSGRGT